MRNRLSLFVRINPSQWVGVLAKLCPMITQRANIWSGNGFGAHHADHMYNCSNEYIYIQIYMGHLKAVLMSYDIMVNCTIFFAHVVTALNPNLITEAVYQDAPKCQYCKMIHLKFHRIILILLVIRRLELLRIVA